VRVGHHLAGSGSRSDTLSHRIDPTRCGPNLPGNPYLSRGWRDEHHQTDCRSPLLFLGSNAGFAGFNTACLNPRNRSLGNPKGNLPSGVSPHTGVADEAREEAGVECLHLN
jgi:hypothetical protein